MARGRKEVSAHVNKLLKEQSVESLRKRLEPHDAPLPPRVPGASLTHEDAVKKRWRLIGASADNENQVYDKPAKEHHEAYSKNIENYIGTVKVPVGLAGPLRVNGSHAKGDYYVPLATTEAAMVASYHRGAIAISESGGCSCLVLSEAVSRTPGFVFRTLAEAGEFVAWTASQFDEFSRIAGTTTRHGELIDMRATVEGNHVYLHFDYSTGDASGQNMVTIATEAVCELILEKSPVKPVYYSVEANMSGDKKASTQSYVTVRGKKVSAEAVISKALLKKRLRTDARRMADYWRMLSLGGVMSGTMGVQGHFANGLAALYLATGQDVACVSESSVGITRFEEHDDGDLYIAVTLPNLMVGTVGGGTGLPGQNACLDIMKLSGSGNARALAEVAAGLALSGELSIIAALSSHEFTRAHKKLAR